MKGPYLLAKRPQNPQEPHQAETLRGHTNRVVAASKAILNLFRDSKGFPEIQGKFDKFELLVLSAAVFHDLGKATDLFQAMLDNVVPLGKKVHPVRHEVLSALLTSQIESPLKPWVQEIYKPYGEEFPWMISWVTGGHHLKLHQDQPHLKKETDRLVRKQGTPSSLIFFGNHLDIQELLNMIPGIIGLNAETPSLENLSIYLEEEDDLQASNLESLVLDYIRTSERFARGLSREEQKLLAFAKAVLIAADVAGSALTPDTTDPQQELTAALSQTLSTRDLEEVIKLKLKGDILRNFQERIAQSTDSVTLTIAGCGSGKTLAAYAWAQRRAVSRKLFFCYPTTGTASAGFEDYLLAQSSIERTLIHGRSQVDLERLLGTPEDNIMEENQRLASLKAWPQQVIACTADTVLGLIQNQRRGLFSFPAIASGAFVFDEIHNYDAKLFGALLNFLDTFSHAPALLMSASIPPGRLEQLRKVLGHRLGEAISGESKIEALDRYILKWQNKHEDCWTKIQAALRAEKKVLWVANTIFDSSSSGAVQVYDQANEKTLGPVLYHSRFRYRDRVDRQDNVLKLFEQQGPALVIATQVCEMSLDIDADLLVTALAPFPALIQRLGRLNRRAHDKMEKDRRLGECLIYNFSCPDDRPYKTRDLELSRQALAPLLEKPLSQRQLASVLADLYHDEEIPTYSAWLDGKWQSDQRPLRAGSDSLTILLKQDLPKIKQHLKDRNIRPSSQNVAAWTIPMLYYPGIHLDEYFAGYPVIGEHLVEYDEIRGARWRKKNWEII